VEQQFDAIAKLIARAIRFVLTTHINPDGDGLGCEVALHAYLVRQGKSARIINHSFTPDFYRFLSPENQIEQYHPATHDPVIRAAEVIFVLDTNHPDRLGSMKDSVVTSSATIVCIDHHLEPGAFAHVYLLDEQATATGEILARLLAYLPDGALTPVMANALYTAIMTDTGSFRYPKTDPETHRIAADLIAHGADPVSSYQQVFEQGSPARLRLLGEVLSGLSLSPSGALAWMVVTQEMFRRTGTTEVDTDAFIPFALTLRGVEIGLMFTELSDCTKISFRSKGEIPINELAKQFGGNGHKNAAGARWAGSPIMESVRDVVAAAELFYQSSRKPS
jgi:bifunctional oligoribonuclease and PAP phosphatase NrnA